MISKLYIYGAIALAALAGYKFWEYRVEKRGAEQNEQIHAKEAFKAGERELAKQGQLVAAKDEAEKKYVQAKKQTATDNAVRDAAEQRLRDELVARRGQAGSNPGTCTGADGDPRDCIIAECSKALGLLDGAVKGLANKSTGLQDYARDVCLKAND